MFLETCPFPLGCPIRWLIIVHSYGFCFLFFVFLHFCSICCFSPLLFTFFVYLGPYSFLLGDPGQRFIDFAYPFKKPALDFIDFFLFFKSLYYLFHL